MQFFSVSFNFYFQNVFTIITLAVASSSYEEIQDICHCPTNSFFLLYALTSKIFISSNHFLPFKSEFGCCPQAVPLGPAL